MSMLLLMTAGMLCGMVGNPGPPDQDRKGDTLGVLYFLCNVHCTTFTVFLHYGFGSEALGFAGLGALLLLGLCAGSDPLMPYWLLAFVVALVMQRLITFALLRRGYIHSRYSGRPLLSKLLPFLRGSNAIAVEVALVFVAGALMMAVSPFIGKFLMLGCLSLIIRTAMEEAVFNRRLQRLRDSELEQRHLAERFRGRGDDY